MLFDHLDNLINLERLAEIDPPTHPGIFEPSHRLPWSTQNFGFVIFRQGDKRLDEECVDSVRCGIERCVG